MSLIPIDQVGNVLLAPRLSAIALTCLFWDHFLTIDDEVAFWRTGSRVGRLSKLAFFVNRYITEIVMLYTVYVISGLTQKLTLTEYDFDHFLSCCDLGIQSLRNSSQHHFHCMVPSISCHLSLISVLNYSYILFRIYSLWDRRRIIAWILMAAFLASVVVITTLMVLAAERLEASRSLNLGNPSMQHGRTAAGQTLFDLFLTALTVYNGLERPHRTHVDVIRDLQAEGMRMFIFLVAIRFMNFLIVLFGPPEYFVSVVSIAWALCSVINSRLHLRLEGLKLVHPPGLGLVHNLK
ncbi:hypothetical protein BD779DRAFT_1671336 [Infundibulicybe gibba]|nr:hypothetical protein BD779DRAFT_1671336 [Infundibulicybe gibba]